MSSRNKKRLKSFVVALTVLLLLLFAWHQYTAYVKDTKTTIQHLRLKQLRGKILFEDEALTMSARLFVLTRDRKWEERYESLVPQYESTFSEIVALLSGGFDGKDKMEKTGTRLFELEEEAMLLAINHQESAANSILFGPEYDRLKKEYAGALQELTENMDRIDERFMTFHAHEAVKNAIVIAAIIFFILIIWYGVHVAEKKHQIKLLIEEQMRADEAVADKKILIEANQQLHLLSAYLQETRDKERLFIAYEINEELGQQLAAIKMQLKIVQKSVLDLSPENGTSLLAIIEQLRVSLRFLGTLSMEVYPSILRDLGMVDALEWESNRLSKQFNSNIIFRAELEGINLSQPEAINLFRIYQEKITSLLLHGAHEIISVLEKKGSGLELRIYDDLPAGHEDFEKGSIENIAIEERVLALNGTSKQVLTEEGTNLYMIRVPVKQDDVC